MKHRKIGSIGDINMSIIYGSLHHPDPITAKNLYLYIKSAMNIASVSPNENVIRLAKEAVERGVRPDPLSIILEMGTGVKTAMAILNALQLKEKDKS